MQLRRTIVEFKTAFTLQAMNGSWPAGSYVIDIGEQPAGDVGSSAARRIATFIHVPVLAHGAKSIEVVKMNAAEFARALWGVRQSDAF